MERVIGPTLCERAMIVGKTGSGKSTLAKEIMRHRPYIVAHDAKGLLDWRGYHRVTTLAEAQKSQAARIIYAPNHFELRSVPTIEAFFEWVYIRRNTTLYVDEVSAVTKRGEIPHYYHAILTRGREFNISTISSSQRPKLIPSVILSEAEHYYVFRLLLLGDRQRIKEMIPLNDTQLQTLGKHDFWYGNAEGETLGPLRLSL